VVEPPARRGRRLSVGAAVVVVVFGALLAAAVLQAMLVTGQDRLDDTNREIAEVEQQLQKDRVQLAAVESPEQLAAAAARIGMVAPAERAWVTSSSAADATAGADATGDGTSTDGRGTVGEVEGSNDQIRGGGSELAGPVGSDGAGAVELR